MHKQAVLDNQKTRDHNHDEQRGVGDYGMVTSATREATEAGAQVRR